MDKIFKKLTNYYLQLANLLKNKPSKIKYLYSEIIYFLVITISKIIEKRELKKLDFEKIKKYYNLYGEEETKNKFNISKERLNNIIG